MPTVVYLELVPGMQHFSCERMHATLSVKACADNWRRGHYEGDLSRLPCKGCEIGAMHAGEAGASRSPLLGTRICGRCHRTGMRLIGKHLCVSCYNREREVRVGKNAKGSPPVKWRALTRRTIAYQLSDGTVAERTIDRAADTDELIVAVLRDERKAVRFGWRAPEHVRQLLDGLDAGLEPDLASAA